MRADLMSLNRHFMEHGHGSGRRAFFCSKISMMEQ
jgi:hypothetical protein